MNNTKRIPQGALEQRIWMLEKYLLAPYKQLIPESELHSIELKLNELKKELRHQKDYLKKIEERKNIKLYIIQGELS